MPKEALKVTFIPFIQSQLEIFDHEGSFSSLSSFAMERSDSLGQPSSLTVTHDASAEKETAEPVTDLYSHSSNGRPTESETASSDQWLDERLPTISGEALWGAFSQQPIISDRSDPGRERRIFRGSDGWDSFLILLLKITKP